MVHTLENGDKVKVWPAPGRQVQSRAGMFGRFLDDKGEELIVDEWVIDRVRDGSMLLHEPGKVTHANRLSDADAIRLHSGELKHCPETGALVEAEKWEEHVKALDAKAAAPKEAPAVSEPREQQGPTLKPGEVGVLTQDGPGPKAPALKE